MLSKNKIKYIRSLDLKKNRIKERVFLAEGPKLVGDMLGHFHCTFLAGIKEWWDRADLIQSSLQDYADETLEITAHELSRASLLAHPQEVLAIFRQPDYEANTQSPSENLCLALDEIQDPGNLGTIIRLADWFGIEDIYCSPGTVDAYNPKVVQATMGALARVRIHYVSLTELILGWNASKLKIPVYGTFLEGDPIYNASLSRNGLVIMGNEGNGLRKEISELVNQKLYIPPFPANRDTSESLNVAIATSIVCSEFRRKYPG